MKKILFILTLFLNGIIAFGQTKSKFEIIEDIDRIINTYGSEYNMEFPNNRETTKSDLMSSVDEGLYYEYDNRMPGSHYSFSGSIPWSNISSASYSANSKYVVIKLNKPIRIKNILGDGDNYNTIRFFIQNNDDRASQYSILISLLNKLSKLNSM